MDTDTARTPTTPAMNPNQYERATGVLPTVTCPNCGMRVRRGQTCEKCGRPWSPSSLSNK